MRLLAGDALALLGGWRSGDPAIPDAPVRLIYLDPPFATGTTFAATVPIGARRSGRPDLRLPAYRDVWEGGLAGYLTFMYDLVIRLRSVLAVDGWLCLHCDHRASAHLRLILDELFGTDAFRNEIVWSYGLGNGTSRRGFPRKHDTLLLYAKSDAAIFTPIRGEVSAAMASKYRHTREDGTRFMRSYGREYDLRGGKPVGSVWEIPSVAPTSGERTGYPTQKPVALLERLILATTAPGDLVLDPCCGSGTTLLAASRLGRPSVGIDTSPLAVAATRTRLVQASVPVDVVLEGVAIEALGRPSRPFPQPLSGPPAPPGSPAEAASAPQVPGEGSSSPDPEAATQSRSAVEVYQQSEPVSSRLPSLGPVAADCRLQPIGARRVHPGLGEGTALGHSISPVRSVADPSDLSSVSGDAIGGHAAGPPRRYVLTAGIARDDRDTEPAGLTVTLHDLRVTATDAPGSSRSTLSVRDGNLVRTATPDDGPITGDWADWLTGWAVHLGVHDPTGTRAFTPVAWSFRAGRDRALATHLSIPIPTGSEPTHLTLRLYDLFGAWSDHALSLTAD